MNELIQQTNAPVPETTEAEIEKELEQARTFNEYFPDGEIEKCDIKDLPHDVIDFFEDKSRSGLPGWEYKPGNFEVFHKVSLENGDTAYLARQNKSLAPGENDMFSYLYEERDSAKVGSGKVVNNLSSDKGKYRNKPYVALTNTQNDYRRQGLAQRRLYLLNAYSQMTDELPLHSREDIGKEYGAMRVWEKITRRGHAENYTEVEKSHDAMGNETARKEYPRYRFRVKR